MLPLLALVLIGCPEPTDTDTDTDTSAQADEGWWSGSIGGAALSDGEITAAWTSTAPGRALAVGPSGLTTETALLGVDLDAAILVWVTDLEAPCEALTAHRTHLAAAVAAMTAGDTEGALEALDAASEALPARFGSVAVGLAAETAADLRGSWDLAPGASGDTPDGWHAAAVVAEQQLSSPDWEALLSGKRDLEDFFATGEVTTGTASSAGITDDRLALDLEGELAGGEAIALQVEAEHCPTLGVALALTHGEPSQEE